MHILGLIINKTEFILVKNQSYFLDFVVQLALELALLSTVCSWTGREFRGFGPTAERVFSPADSVVQHTFWQKQSTCITLFALVGQATAS